MIDVSHIPLHRLAISKQLVVAADAAAPAPGLMRRGWGAKISASEFVNPPSQIFECIGFYPLVRVLFFGISCILVFYYLLVKSVFVHGILGHYREAFLVLGVV